MKLSLLIIFVLVVLNSCGSAKSDSTHAEVIPAPLAGYTCFAIKDDAGKTVGGNCLPQQ
jgi:hypothetical protein